MKIYCQNVRVWTRDRDKSSEWFWKKRMARIRAMIMSQDPDILCLQELSFPANLYLPKNYRRVGLTASHPVYVKSGIKTRHHRFHFRFDTVELPGPGLFLVNVHLHWDDKIFNRCIRRINKAVNKAVEKGLKVVVCGDFNKGYLQVRDSLTPAATVLPPDEMFYTFHNPLKDTYGTIDYFAVSRDLVGKVDRKVEAGMVTTSDHLPLILTIQ